MGSFGEFTFGTFFVRRSKKYSVLLRSYPASRLYRTFPVTLPGIVSQICSRFVSQSRDWITAARDVENLLKWLVTLLRLYIRRAELLKIVLIRQKIRIIHLEMVGIDQINTENPFAAGHLHSRLSRYVVTFLRRSHAGYVTHYWSGFIVDMRSPSLSRVCKRRYFFRCCFGQKSISTAWANIFIS